MTRKQVKKALANPSLTGLAALVEKMRKQIAMDYREFKSRGKLFHDDMPASARGEEIEWAVKRYGIDVDKELSMSRELWR